MFDIDRISFTRFEREEIEQSIPDRFEKQVDKHFNKLAIKTRNYEFSYGDLNRQANRLARAILNQRGTGEERIALVLENGAPMIAAMLGVLKLGKTYVPLDPGLPRSRTDYILEDSQSTLIVTNNKNLAFATELADNNLPLINIDGLDHSLPAENVALDISPDTLIWMLYTSGSTGQPKGVVHNHRNLLHFVMNYTNGFHLSADDRLSLLFSCGVNAGAHNIYSALLNGASLYPFDIKVDGLTNLADWLIRNEITIYSSVPTVFGHFIDTLTKEEFPDLRLVVMMGEPVYKWHVDLYKKHFSNRCIFVNRLGSTETGSIRWNFISKKTQIDGNNVPVGYPVVDNEILLLDENGMEVEPGQVGEISVRSRYLSPGYWRKPERTKAAFLPDPEGGDKRIYRTGDLGRIMQDGCLMHLGRIDFQIKIRGYRIEVAEIEAVLIKHDAVKEAVVWIWEDRSGDKRLVAYIVPMDGQKAPTVTELRRLAAENLPEYMIPSIFVTLEAMPLAPNGKLNRRALPPPDTDRPELEEKFIAPRNELELKLAKIWEEVLDIQPIGVKDDFFDVGGNSMLAMRIFNQIQETLGSTLPLAILFQTATVEQLAELLSALLSDAQENT